MVTIRNDERVAFIGATGTGKTVLASHFLATPQRAIAVDPKHKLRLPGYRIARGLPMLQREWRIILRPGMGPAADESLASTLFEAWKRSNVIIYVDELTSVSERFPMSTSVLEEIARTGRERRVGLWTAMQRPRFVPRLFLTESEVFFVFSLRDENDRSHMAGFVGKEASDPIDMHSFWYIRPGMEGPEHLKLNLAHRKLEMVNGRQREGREGREVRAASAARAG